VTSGWRRRGPEVALLEGRQRKKEGVDDGRRRRGLMSQGKPANPVRAARMRARLCDRGEEGAYTNQ
jgi:hypothetical protein